MPAPGRQRLLRGPVRPVHRRRRRGGRRPAGRTVRGVAVEPDHALHLVGDLVEVHEAFDVVLDLAELAQPAADLA
jgi:hypothetical protein